MIHLSLHDPVGISYWNRNLPHCWVWSSAAPGCPVACSWKTLGWQTCRWTPSSPPCCRSRPSCELQPRKRRDIGCTFKDSRVWWCEKGGRRAVCTHWVQWRRCRGLWWAAASTYRCHFLPATAQNLLILHNQAGTSVGIKTWLYNMLQILSINRTQCSDIQSITVHWLGRICQHV